LFRRYVNAIGKKPSEKVFGLNPGSSMDCRDGVSMRMNGDIKAGKAVIPRIK